MATDGKITWLRDTLGDTLRKEDIDTLASHGDRFSVPAGRVLARTGEYGREAFVIVSGRVEVRRNGERIAILGPGDVAGELAVTGAVRRNADLVATTQVDLVVFDAASFRGALHVSQSLADRVEQARRDRTQVA